MQAAMVVTFGNAIVGREAKALEYSVEVDDFWNKRAQEGKCSVPELFISENANGIWMVKGDRDVLMEIHDSDQARLLTLKGDLLLENFNLQFYYAGDSAADEMMRYQSALSAIS